MLTTGLFRAHVLWGADYDACPGQRPALFRGFCDAEVHEEDTPLFPLEEYVLRLDVPMDDPCLMCGGES